MSPSPMTPESEVIPSFSCVVRMPSVASSFDRSASPANSEANSQSDATEATNTGPSARSRRERYRLTKFNLTISTLDGALHPHFVVFTFFPAYLISRGPYWLAPKSACSSIVIALLRHFSALLLSISQCFL